MFDHFRKYRNFFAVGFMAFYLAGGLQFSVMECLHFMSHIDEMVEGKYTKHHFHSPNGDHLHAALTVLDTQSSDPNHENIPVSDTSDSLTKKSPQIFYPDNTNSFCFVEKTTLEDMVVHRLDGLHPSVPSPPPRI